MPQIGHQPTCLRKTFSRVRILCVDDEPVNREVSSQQLAEANLNFDLAGDRAEAVAVVDAWAYELTSQQA